MIINMHRFVQQILNGLLTISENKIWQRKQKKEWIELFNSIDDDVEIEIAIEHSRHYKKGKLKKIGITIYH